MAHINGHKLELIEVDGKKEARACPSTVCLLTELRSLRLRKQELAGKVDALKTRLAEVAAEEAELAALLRELGEVV